MKKLYLALGFTCIIGYFVFFIFTYTAFLQIPLLREAEEKTFSEIEAADMVRNNYLEQQLLLFDFIARNLMKDKGEVYTNLQAKSRNEVLSESIGLMMNYAVMQDDKELFNKELEFVKENMLTNDKLIKWQSSDQSIHCNAVIDDLRIVRSLLDAYAVWQNEEYLALAASIQEGLYINQVKEGNLYEFYDWQTGSIRKRIPLCYLDIYTLDRISIFNEGWGEAANNAIDVIKRGRISDESPFFYKYYDYTNGKYSFDEEFAKSKGICITYSLYSAIHLAEVNEDTKFFSDWLKSEAKKGTLYAWYSPYSLKPTKKMESTAVYALASVYARKVGEKELSKVLIDKMKKFMVTDENSPYYGGYGEKITRSFYSFDNLTALWALAEMNR